MTANKVKRVLKEIGDDLNRAVAYYEVYVPTGQNQKVIDSVNSKKVHEAFNVISEALQLSVISALCRIWDNTKSTSGINKVVTGLHKAPALVRDNTAYLQWLKDVEEVEQSEEFQALRGFRHNGLSHRCDPNLPDPRSLSGVRRVLYGDERKILEKTILIVNQVNQLIGQPQDVDFDKLRTDWQMYSANFWTAHND